jgi:O-antigen/teichoic acid export membrane protein
MPIQDEEKRMTLGSKPGALIRQGLRRVLGEREAWALTDQATVSATNFLTNVILARFMGLHEFGVFALAWMSVLFVNSLQYAVVVSPMMSIGPKQSKEERPTYFGAVVFQEVVLAALCFVLVYAVLRIFGGNIRGVDVRYLAFPLATAAFGYQLQDFLRRYFFATAQSRRAFIDDLISYLSQLPILIVLHAIGRLNSVTALWAMSGTSLFGLAVGWLWVEPLKFQWQRIKSVSLHHWRFSRWLGIAALLQWTSGNLFVLAAPLYYGAAAAGVLKASQNLMGVTHIWFKGLDNVVPAEAARQLHQNGIRSMLAYIRSIVFKWGGLTVLFAMVMGAAPGLWLRLVYGPQMEQYGYILRLYALLYVLLFLAGPLQAGLQAIEFTVPIFWSYSAMTVFSTVLAVPMAKWLKLNGVMLGLLGAQLLFQSIVWAALLLKSRSLMQKADSPPRSTAIAK